MATELTLHDLAELRTTTRVLARGDDTFVLTYGEREDVGVFETFAQVTVLREGDPLVFVISSAGAVLTVKSTLDGASDEVRLTVRLLLTNVAATHSQRMADITHAAASHAL